MHGPEHERTEEGLREQWLHEGVECLFHGWPWTCKETLEKQGVVRMVEEVTI